METMPVPELVYKMSIRKLWCWTWWTRSQRHVEVNKNTIKALIDADRISTRKMAKRLKSIGLTSKLDLYLPHLLTGRNLWCRVLKGQENYAFLKSIITDDKMWVVYNNVKPKRSSSKKDEPTQNISTKTGGGMIHLNRKDQNWLTEKM